MSVIFTRYGVAAYEALRDAKRGDPLTPVTVLVPSLLCGIVARRPR